MTPEEEEMVVRSIKGPIDTRWKSLFDTALVAFVSYKLEQFLTEVLIKLIFTYPKKLTEIDKKYNSYYDRDKRKQVTKDDKLRGDALKMEEKLEFYRSNQNIYRGDARKILIQYGLSLGNLSFECFDSEFTITYILRILDDFSEYEKEADYIRKIRNSILHYGKRNPPHQLKDDKERKKFKDQYMAIIDGKVIREMAAVGPQERQTYFEVIDIDEWRAIRELYISLEVRTKQEIKEIKEEMQRKEDEAAHRNDELAFENNSLQGRVDEEQNFRVRLEVELHDKENRLKALTDENNSLKEKLIIAKLTHTRCTQTEEVQVREATNNTESEPPQQVLEVAPGTEEAASRESNDIAEEVKQGPEDESERPTDGSEHPTEEAPTLTPQQIKRRRQKEEKRLKQQNLNTEIPSVVEQDVPANKND